MTRRRGYSLVELLVIVSGVALVMILGAALVHALLRAERATRDGMAEGASAARLARDLRADVHAAVALSSGPEGEAQVKSVVLTRPGGASAEYRVEGDGLIVSHRDGDRQRAETFTFPRRGSPRLEVDRGDGRTWVVLRIERGTGSARAIRVEAELGRDHRHEPEGDRS